MKKDNRHQLRMRKSGRISAFLLLFLPRVRVQGALLQSRRGINCPIFRASAKRERAKEKATSLARVLAPPCARREDENFFPPPLEETDDDNFSISTRSRSRFQLAARSECANEGWSERERSKNNVGEFTKTLTRTKPKRRRKLKKSSLLPAPTQAPGSHRRTPGKSCRTPSGSRSRRT